MESKMKNTLALLLEEAVSEDKADSSDKDAFVNWATKFPAQVMILATQINWSMGVDGALKSDNPEAALKDRLSSLEGKLAVMAETVLLELPADNRKKFEQMVRNRREKEQIGLFCFFVLRMATCFRCNFNGALANHFLLT